MYIRVAIALLVTAQFFPALANTTGSGICSSLIHPPSPETGSSHPDAAMNSRVTSQKPDEYSAIKRHRLQSSVTVFAGAMTNNTWEEIFTPNKLRLRDTQIVGVAASREIWRPADALTLGIEGQIVRHIGHQDNWEFNFPAFIRWQRFPWDRWLDTSFSFGIGPSYASETPKGEVAREGGSQKWLVYWFGEVGLHYPRSPWSGIVRLHHRSEAFGLVADEGGSNVLVAGVRRRF